ncbi:MAG: DUF418 domain-containing protein [Calditrichia bacterium]
MSQPSLSQKGSSRIVGYDVARALAVFGMIFVNFKLVMTGYEAHSGWIAWCLSLLEGRAAATFVILAGVGLSLISRRAYNASDTTALRHTRFLLLKRALFLFVVGLLYTPIWPADILHFYGLYIAVCAFLLTVSNRRLLWIAAGFTLGFVVLMLLFDYETGWNWATLEYQNFWTLPGMVRHMFFNGFHPVIPWTSFMIFGMWLGRQDIRNKLFRRRLFLISLTVVAITEFTSHQLIRSLSANADQQVYEIIVALFGTAPMPPMPLYILSAGGTAVILILLSIILTENITETRWVKALISTGQLALTNYFAHVIIGMGALETFGLLESSSVLSSVIASSLFCLLVVLFSYHWQEQFKRGPLEWIIRKCTG